uniref:Uncharacterized protein n=1 Tax=Pseudomonas phage Nican01 TaxID=3138540 RepID=A0AAU6W0R6_9CAUD
MSEMNTDDCKDLICQFMNNLLGGVSSDDLRSFERTTGGDLGDVVDKKLWKRVSKSGSKNNVTRVFKHTTIEAIVTLQEMPNSDGTVSLEVDMTELPEALQNATTVVGEVSLPGNGRVGATKAMRNDPQRPSMTEGPKPEGFGAFA